MRREQLYHHGPLQILLLDSAGTEQVSVGEVLRGHVSDGQLGQHHLGPRLVDLLQLVVQDVPLGVHDGLVVLKQDHDETFYDCVFPVWRPRF